MKPEMNQVLSLPVFGKEEKNFSILSLLKIELCEKALNEYLEQEKKIFARFYFVSN